MKAMTAEAQAALTKAQERFVALSDEIQLAAQTFKLGQGLGIVAAIHTRSSARAFANAADAFGDIALREMPELQQFVAGHDCDDPNCVLRARVA